MGQLLLSGADPSYLEETQYSSFCVSVYLHIPVGKMLESATNRIFYDANEKKSTCVNMPLNCVSCFRSC